MSAPAVIAAAAWLGLLTSISPCPLAGDIAAMSFISRNAGRPRSVLLSGLLYVLGRTVAYVGLAALILTSVFSQDRAVAFLDRHLNTILGPLLILSGMLLSGLVQSPASLSLAGRRLGQRAAGGSILWAAALGFVLALSFCPVTAGLYASMLATSAAAGSGLLAPLAFGLGTAIPNAAFAVLMTLGSTRVAAAYNKLNQLQRWTRPLTGGIIILAGIYYTLTYIFDVSLMNW